MQSPRIQAEKRLTVRPMAGLLGLALFSLTTLACSGGSSGGSPQAKNAAPTATAPGAVLLDEDSASPPIGLTGTDAEDAEGLLTVAVTVPPANGSLDFANGTAPLQVVYTPDPNFFGEDRFEFTVTDSGGKASAAEPVVLTVGGLQDAPTIEFVDDVVAVVGTPFSLTPVAEDVDGETLTFALGAKPLPGWASFDAATGTISGTPGPADVGSTNGLRLTVSDAIDARDSNFFNLTVVGLPPDHLAVVAGVGADETAGLPWSPVQVEVRDATDALVPVNGLEVTMVLASGSGLLKGGITALSVDGVATFDAVTYEVAEAITVDFTSPGLGSALGLGLSVRAGASAQIAFGLTPSSEESVDAIWSVFTVEIMDAFGNPADHDDSTEITVGLVSGLGTLGGLRSKSAQEGVAIFDDITYDRAELIELAANADPVLTVALSGPIDVRGGFAVGGDIELLSRQNGKNGTVGNNDSKNAQISFDGRLVVYESNASNLVNKDGNKASDVFVRDRETDSTSIVSVASDGKKGDGPSTQPTMSANGRYVAFTSEATNLVENDLNAVSDVFLHDRSTGETKRISLSAGGTEANGASHSPSLSASGRFVAFASDATNLVLGDSNGVTDIFCYDVLTGNVERASVNTDGEEANGPSTNPSLSGAGETVAFESLATNLLTIGSDINQVMDVFARDMVAGQTVRVSESNDGIDGAGASSAPSISVSGRFVAFQSEAPNLVDSDHNGLSDVFVRDLVTRSTSRVSVDDETLESDGASIAAGISGDGRYVAYQTEAANFDAEDINGVADVYVHDRLTGISTRLSQSAEGEPGNALSGVPALSFKGDYVAFESDAANLVPGDGNGARDVFAAPNTVFSQDLEIDINSVSTEGRLADMDSFSPSVSSNGRYVVYETPSTNLVDSDTNFQFDIFVHDRFTKQTRRVTIDKTGFDAVAESRLPTISDDGRFVVFESMATNIAPGDNNGKRDIFVHDRLSGRTELVSVDSQGLGANGHSFNPSVSANGRWIVFESSAMNLDPADNTPTRDIYMHDRATGKTECVSMGVGGAAGDQASRNARISPDGQHVVFESDATNLVVGDTNGMCDIFTYNCQTGALRRVTRGVLGLEANGNSHSPAISANGLHVVWSSDASNLVSDDTNGRSDVFCYDLEVNGIERLSMTSVGTEADDDSGRPLVSNDGRWVGFESNATNLIALDVNQRMDVFICDRVTGELACVSVDALGSQANGDSLMAAMAGDGSYVSFASKATNLVAGDGNGRQDIFTAPNPIEQQ